MQHQGAIKQILIITVAALLTLLIMKWISEGKFENTIKDVKVGISSFTDNIDGAKENLENIKNKFNETAEKINETKEKVEDKINKIETAVNEVNEAYDAVKQVTE